VRLFASASLAINRIKFESSIRTLGLIGGKTISAPCGFFLLLNLLSPFFRIGRAQYKSSLKPSQANLEKYFHLGLFLICLQPFIDPLFIFQVWLNSNAIINRSCAFSGIAGTAENLIIVVIIMTAKLAGYDVVKGKVLN